jgi:ATP-binding cassette subfamily G (WHITE) protein 2 (SNQ2)
MSLPAASHDTKVLEEYTRGPSTGATTNTSDRTSIDTATDLETKREVARQNNPNGFSNPSGGVDVAGAEAQFAELQRHLSGISQTSRKLSRTQSRQSAKQGISEKDIENAPSSSSADEEDRFDLEETLHGAHAADEESGIRPKHIGVVWNGLTVSGVGGVTNFVKTVWKLQSSFMAGWETC